MNSEKNTPSARNLFAQNLKKYRKGAKISQEKLAELSGLHRNYIGGVERGEINISVDNMEKIAKTLGVSVKGMFNIN